METMTTSRLRDPATGRFITAQAAPLVIEPAPAAKKDKKKQEKQQLDKKKSNKKKRKNKKKKR